MLTVTQILADYLYALDFEDIPPPVVGKAKSCILDALGCGLGASDHSHIEKMINALTSYDSSPTSSIWGNKEKASLWTAALLNSSMVHCFDFDDAHKEAKVHAGAVIIPLALAIAELKPISGRQLITAIVGAYEVMLRIAIGVGSSSHRLKGWHNTATCGPFGAAAVACKLLELKPDQITSAFGTAGTQSSGLWAFAADGSMSKKFHAGRAAQSGAISAFLAKEGFTGSTKIIEAEDGGLFRAVSDDYDYSKVTEGLGESFEILQVSFKPYPCCRTIHPAIDAVLQVREKVALDIIKEIRVYTYKVAKKQNDLPLPPQNGSIAQFNMPFILALALFEGGISMQHFCTNFLKDEKILNMAKKVKVILDEEIERDYPKKWRCKLEIETTDGKVHTAVTDAAKGDTANPLTAEEHCQKFYGLLKDKEFDSKELYNKISILEKVEDVKELLNLIVLW